MGPFSWTSKIWLFFTTNIAILRGKNIHKKFFQLKSHVKLFLYLSTPWVQRKPIPLTLPWSNESGAPHAAPYSQSSQPPHRGSHLQLWFLLIRSPCNIPRPRCAGIVGPYYQQEGCTIPCSDQAYADIRCRIYYLAFIGIWVGWVRRPAWDTSRPWITEDWPKNTIHSPTSTA